MAPKTTTVKRPLSDFFGILNEKEANLLEKTIERSRKLHKKLHEKRIKRMLRELKVKDKLIIGGD